MCHENHTKRREQEGTPDDVEMSEDGDLSNHSNFDLEIFESKDCGADG